MSAVLPAARVSISFQVRTRSLSPGPASQYELWSVGRAATGQWSSMWWEGQGRDPVVVGLQTCGPPGATWQLRIPEPPGLQLPPEGRGSTLLSFPNNPFVCAGVWDQKERAEDSKGLRVPVWASVAPERDRTSCRGPCPWLQLIWCQEPPGPEAQLQPVCPLWACSGPKVQREVWGTPTWVPGCALGPLRSTNAAPWP